MCKCLYNYEEIKKKLSIFSQGVFNNGFVEWYDVGYNDRYNKGSE